jgi:hypothetical protein
MGDAAKRSDGARASERLRPTMEGEKLGALKTHSFRGQSAPVLSRAEFFALPPVALSSHRRIALSLTRPSADYAPQIPRNGPCAPNTGSLSGTGRDAIFLSACGRSPGLPVNKSQSRPSG